MIGHRNRKLKPTYQNQSPSTSYCIHPLSHEINTTTFHTIVVQNRSASFLAGRPAPFIDAISFPETLNNGSSHYSIRVNRPPYCILEFSFPHRPPGDSMFYCRFPLINSIGQFILSATGGHDQNCQRKITVISSYKY